MSIYPYCRVDLMPDCKLIHTAAIPLALTNRNDGRGHAWYRTANERASIESLLLAERLARHQPFPCPVTLHLTRVLGKGQRYWDADSGLRGNAKELIDSLVAVGWFHDDGHKWIQEVRFFQDGTQRHNAPLTIVAVYVDNRLSTWHTG